MNRLIPLIIILLSYSLGFSQTNQSWNPYLNQGIISPAPLLPFEMNGQGVAAFNLGNTGSNILPLVVGDELEVQITLSNGEPNNANPLSALSGGALSYFDWTYDVASKSYTGIQILPIPALFVGDMRVDYLVLINTALSNAGNGFVATLTPPNYTLNINTTDDDGVSSYTFVRARDYGDAPMSYGSAGTEIDYFKDINGNYEWLVMLGDTIDHDSAYLGSSMADGDDSLGLNDEDGVIFPASITPGSTITVPVELKVLGGFGFLNAWIDWNANGSFESSEQIITNTFGFNSQTLNVQINVPSNAVSGTTFARFRFGEVAGPTGFSLYGEVEDYAINIGSFTPSITLNKTGIYQDLSPLGVYNPGDQISYSFSITNTGNVALSNISIADSMVNVSGGPLSVLNPGEVDSVTFSAIYTLTQNDIDSGTLTNMARVTGYYNGNEVTDEDEDVQSFVQTPSLEFIKTAQFVNGSQPNPFRYNNVGDVITYAFNVTNTGNVTLTSLRIDDALTGSSNLSLSPAILLPSEVGTASATYIIIQNDLDSGFVLNEATATGDFNGQNVFDSDTAYVQGVQLPAIQIIKLSTTDPNYYSQIGDTLTYSLEITNTGNLTLSNIILSDSLAVIVGNPLSSLVPGQRDTLSAFYLVTQMDLNNEQFVNLAEVSGTYTDVNGVNQTVADEDDETILARIPDLSPVVTVIVNAMQGTTLFHIIVKVTELNNVATQGVVTATLPKDSRVSLNQPFDPNLTTLSDISLNNSEWTYSDDSLNHIFTSTSVISAGGFSTFGLVAEFDPAFAKGFYTLTSQIASGSGGEVRINNNVDAEKINFFIE